MNTKTLDQKTLDHEANYKLASELQNTVSKWVDTFNFIQIDVLNLVAEHKENTGIYDFIRHSEYDFEDVAEYSDLTAKQLKRKYKNVEDCPEYETMREEKEQANYPMWNTCFEFKHEPSEDILKAAEEAGFGIIENLGDFNPILFVAGCGYSFYAAHWIPLYLALPWNTKEAEKYKGVNYEMI